jgi:hypothetical protein
MRPEIDIRMMVANKSLADAVAQYSSNEWTQLNEVSLVPGLYGEIRGLVRSEDHKKQMQAEGWTITGIVQDPIHLGC